MKEEKKEKIDSDNKNENDNNNLNKGLDDQILQLTEKLNAAIKESDEFKDKYLRQRAEFDNYKKRTENEKLILFEYSGEIIIKKLLPIIDDFERSLQHIENAKDIDTVKEGINMIYNKFIKLLDDQGVKPIEALGKPFDYNFHDAIMKQPTPNVDDETVINEIEKGYLYKDKVIRHSKVIISEAISDENNENV